MNDPPSTLTRDARATERSCQEFFGGCMKDDRAKLDARKERYLRDPLPARLGNLASNLARIKSIATQPDLGEAAKRVIRESKHFVEWAGKDADLQVQIELVELQRQLAQWQFKWSEIWSDTERRAGIAAQAGAWSQRILERSGLLKM